MVDGSKMEDYFGSGAMSGTTVDFSNFSKIQTLGGKGGSHRWNYHPKDLYFI